MIIEINGVKYIQNEKVKGTSSRRNLSPELFGMMMIGQLMGGGYGYETKREPKRPAVNIIEEYKLIQQKKSGLSKSQRDWVCRQFHYNFTKVDDK